MTDSRRVTMGAAISVVSWLLDELLRTSRDCLWGLCAAAGGGGGYEALPRRAQCNHSENATSINIKSIRRAAG